MSVAQEIKDQTPLEALIGKYVPLASNGREFEALCPFHKEKSPSFRVVPDKGFFHCLAAETRVITWDGTTDIAALAGSVAKVLTRGGKWVDAKFQSYGTQRLFRVCLSRNGVRKTIFSTSGHRWFARGRNKDLTTVDLRPGYRLEAVIPERRREWIIDPEGIRHGIVYGDGTLQNGIYGHVNLHGEHKMPLSAWFSDFNPKIRTTSNGEPYIKVYGGRSFSHMKHLPSKDASPAYLLGFLAGYIAADGHVAKDGTVMLHSSERSNLEWVRDIATRLGVSTFGITHADRKGYLDHETPIYRLHFVSSTLHPSLFLKTMAHARYVASNKRFERLRWSVVSIEETDRVEEVYCAEVPVEHAFVLEDNLLSGNCFGCGEHGDAIDFVMRFHGVQFKEALAIMGGDNVEPLSARPRQQRAPVVDLYAEFEPILPVPSDVPPILPGQRTPKILNPKRKDDPDKRLTSFRPSLVHPYLAADGSLTGYVLRVDMGDGRKITPAIMWCTGPDGVAAWTMFHFPTPRTLYGAHLLASSPKAVVILVEGEKAADAARLLFPKAIALTWAGGSKAASKTDWAPLAGRKVALWPDADEPGIKVMLQIGSILTDLCCTVTIADTADLPENFDAADLEPGTDAVKWLKDRLRPFVPPADEPAHDEVPHAEPDDIVPAGHDYAPHPDIMPSYKEMEDKVTALSEMTAPTIVEEIALEIAHARLGDVQTDRLLRLMKERTKANITTLKAIVGRAKKSHARSQAMTIRREHPIGDQYVFVKAVNQFWDRNARGLMALEAVRNHHWSEMPEDADGLRISPLMVLLQDKDGCDKADSITFHPGQPELIKEGSTTLLNNWTPPTCPRTPGDATPFERHVAMICDGNEIATAHVLDFMAHLVQRPAVKIRSTLLIIGMPGIGKSIITDTLTIILGEKNVAAVEESQLRSSFNEWMDGTQLVIVNELQSMDRKETMNRLKTYITDRYITINRKNTPTFSYQNRANFMMFSNHRDAASIDIGDRRYFVWESHMPPMPESYYRELHDWRDRQGGIGHIHHYLATRDLSNFNPMAHAPMTDIKQEIQSMSVSGIQSYVQEAIDAWDPPFGSDIISLNQTQDYLAAHKRLQLSHQKLSSALKGIGALDLGRVTVDGRRRRVWAIREFERWSKADELTVTAYLVRVGYFATDGTDRDSQQASFDDGPS